MSFQDAFTKLEKNTPEKCEETIRILCKIADNILKDPTNLKIRTLQKSNARISNTILSINGGKECLKLMGFEEKDTYFVMGTHIPLRSIEEFKKALLSWTHLIKQKSISKVENVSTVEAAGISSDSLPDRMIRKIKLPPLQLTFTNPLLRKMEIYSHEVLQYEDEDLQQRIRNIIPISRLEGNAQKRLRLVQEHIKKNKLKDPDLSIQDMLICELLEWFKGEFFSWVNSPTCDHCGGETSMSHMSSDPKLLVYTDRVELHRCKTCQKFTPFGRYNDVNILLETRRGRCGEWANTFSSCCRAMGWDVRFVVDEEDHVWTEVFSVTQKRWLHCDPCENICDTPLVYESGWKKKLSYVIAYAVDDIQDVTWRYSSNHGEVCKRRKQCSEEELLAAIFKIRSNLQKNLTVARKAYLLRRNLMEVADFLTERKVTENDLKGRNSGSESWRLARGEIQESSSQSLYVWKIKPDDIIENSVTISYSCALNKYRYISGNKIILELDDWKKGTYQQENVFRKIEQDWKMVYLARNESETQGTVHWSFDIPSDRKLDTVAVKFEHETYENGQVSIKICTEDTCELLPKGQKFLLSNNFQSATGIKIYATLSGGKGDTAWQHSQLFRQSVESFDFNFSVTFTFQ